MSTNAKIDFKPDLFDEMEMEAAPDQPAIQPKQRTNRVPFIVAGGLLLILSAMIFATIVTIKPKTFQPIPLNGPQTVMDEFSLSLIEGNGQAIQRSHTNAYGDFCVGSELLCSTSTTEKPAETLAKLAAALPAGEAKRYRLKVSIVPVDE